MAQRVTLANEGKEFIMQTLLNLLDKHDDLVEENEVGIFDNQEIADINTCIDLLEDSQSVAE